MIKLLSIELTNRCGKACSFCYNHSGPSGKTHWEPQEVIALLIEGAAHELESVSFGGGEPLEYDGLEAILQASRGVLHRSITTNGLLLDDAWAARLAMVGLEKAHVSVHFPDRPEETERAIRCVRQLDSVGVRAGVNLLVRQSGLDAAAKAVRRLKEAGIANDRIIYLPMRIRDEPTPKQVAQVAGPKFQSMSCLSACARSHRFVSIDWKQEVAWCSYTSARRRLSPLSWAGLCAAVEDLDLIYCGAAEA